MAFTEKVDNLSPLLQHSYALRSPVRLGNSSRSGKSQWIETKRPREEEEERGEEEGEEEEDDTVADDFFDEIASPANTNQTTPDWNITPSNSPAVQTKKTKLKSTYRPPIRSSSPTAPTATPAHARPLYNDRSNSGESTGRNRAGLKKQLMPSIPIRRESAGTPNEGMGTRSKSATNIQTLAQAIAARAQHVAAANALARASNPDTSSSSVPTTHQSDQLDAVPSTNILLGRISPSDSIPRSISTYSTDFDTEMIKAAFNAFQKDADTGTPLDTPKGEEEERTVRSENTIMGTSILSAAEFDAQMARNSTHSNGGNRWSKAGWSMSHDLVDTRDSAGTNEVDSNDTSHGKFRTSDSDHSVISTTQTSHDRHSGSLHGLGTAPNITELASTPSQTNEASQGVSTLEAQSDKSKSSMAGLGILEANTHLVKALHSSSPINQSASIRSLDSYATAPDSASPQAAASANKNALDKISTSPDVTYSGSPSMASVVSPTLSPNPNGSSRKSRPSALTLNTMVSSPKTPSTPSGTRSMASPSRGKTPPPTMPPTEPLPPVPPTSSSAFKRYSSKSAARTSSPRTSGTDSSYNPLIAAFISNRNSEDNNHLSDLSSEASPSGLENQSSQFTPVRNRSLKRNSGLAAKSAALVSANHATTLAGAELAQAILNKVTPEPSFNEKRVSSIKSGVVPAKRSSDPVVALPRRRASDVDAKEVNQAATTSKVIIQEEEEDPIRVPSSVAALPYDQSDDSEEEEEGEEAVITRVLSVTDPITVSKTTPPKLVRTDSASSRHALLDQAKFQSAPPSNVRKLSTGPPSTWNTRQVDKAGTLKRSTSFDSETNEPWMPAVETPTFSVTHSDFTASGAWSVQNRRNEMDQDRKSISPTDTFGRLKRTEGRFTGAFGEIALAFKQLQAEKKTLERVIRATTPLSGLGDGQDLSQYLTSMSSKLALSAAEIKRLLDLMDQQRSVMDYMVETHQLEVDAFQEEIDELNNDLDNVETEAQTHRMNCIKLTEDLDRSHAEAIQIRAETLRAKSVLTEEETKREKFVNLLQAARGHITRLETEKSEGEDAHNATKLTLENVHRKHADELQAQKAAYEKELDLLRLQLGGGAKEIAAKTEDTETRESVVSKHPSNEKEAWEERVATLQRELAESKKSQLESERQLQEHKVAALARNTEESSIESISPLIAGSSDVEEALRDKLIQQEKDIADLRASLALGGGVGATKEERLASLPAGRANQVQMLLADLADKRAREVQIRSAYKQLRDELRKLQLAQQQDRKRNQASYSYLSGANSAAAAAAGTSSTSAHGHGMAPPSSCLGGALDSSKMPGTPNRDARESTTTPRALKRLSLPLATQFNANNSNIVRNTNSPSAQSRLSVDGSILFNMARRVSAPGHGGSLDGHQDDATFISGIASSGEEAVESLEMTN